jgi:hypothetical protein
LALGTGNTTETKQMKKFDMKARQFSFPFCIGVVLFFTFMQNAQAQTSVGSTQENSVIIAFDFSACQSESICVNVYFGNTFKIAVNAGEKVDITEPYQDLYIVRYEYENTAQMLPFAEKIHHTRSFDFPYGTLAYTVTVPPPSSDPSGVAKVRFVSRFSGPVWVWLEGGIDGRHGYIHEINRGANTTSSKISPAGNSGFSSDFDIPASRYKIKVLSSDMAVSFNVESYKLYELDAFDFPSALGRYEIELAPAMGEEKNRTLVMAQMTFPMASNTNAVPIQAKIEIEFSAPVIPPLVERNIQLYKEYNTSAEDVIFIFSWMDENKRVAIATFDPLAKDMEYRLVVSLNACDRSGNRLRASEQRFFTGAAIAPMLKPVFAVAVTWNGRINMGEGLRGIIETLLCTERFEVTDNKEGATHIIEGIFSGTEHEASGFITFITPGIRFNITKKDTDAMNSIARNFYNIANLNVQKVPNKSWLILHQRAYNMIKANVEQNFIKALKESHVLD